MLNKRDVVTLYIDRKSEEHLELIHEIKRVADDLCDGVGPVFYGSYPMLGELFQELKGD